MNASIEDPLSLKHYAGNVHWFVRKRVWSVLDESQMKNGYGSLEYSTFSINACNHTEFLCPLNTAKVMYNHKISRRQSLECFD